MSDPGWIEKIKVHPDAYECLKRNIDSYKWALKNYGMLQEKHGRGKYIVILDCKVVGETTTLSNESQFNLMRALEVRYPGEYEAFCVIPLF